MSTLREVATRLMAAGLDDLEALVSACQAELGHKVSARTVGAYRSAFRKHGPTWWVHEDLRHRDWAKASLAKKLTGQARQSATKRGLEFSLTAEGVGKMLEPMRCSVTGLPLTLEHEGPSVRNPWAPSLDRVDCSRGYVIDNVRVVCWAYNVMRADFPDSVVRTVVEALMVSFNEPLT